MSQTYNKQDQQPIALGITGASGAIYGTRLLECLIAAEIPTHLVISEAGKLVLKEELGLTPKKLAEHDLVTLHSPGEIGSSIASGSHTLRATIICPCTANTAGALAQGVGDNLLARMGAVALKERWPLIIVPRESPYSTPLLENLKSLSLYGAHILPASPSFYRKPKSIRDLVDSVVDRVLVKTGLEPILPPWTGPGADW
jgi:4-hydroxy-3-polyprenylbenzoate decarboxylase